MTTFYSALTTLASRYETLGDDLADTLYYGVFAAERTARHDVASLVDATNRAATALAEGGMLYGANLVSYAAAADAAMAAAKAARHTFEVLAKAVGVGEVEVKVLLEMAAAAAATA